MRHSALLFSLLIIVSCNKNEAVSQGLEEQKNMVKLNDVEQGKLLLEDNDCMACHQFNENAIGPSYKDIANKYTEKDIDYLADKMINGGSGVWGEVPMSPHPNIEKANAQKIVKYILTQKN